MAMRWLGTALVAASLLAVPANAEGEAMTDFRFDSIDGGAVSLSDWEGRPILVANTASLCGYTPQYAELQSLHDAYKDRGLVVLAVPSNDFRQELGSDAAVAEFCEVNYGLDLPMTAITRVTGPEAHPFYRWLAETRGYAPQWNFGKVLIGADGAVLGTWGSAEAPMGPAITGAVEAALGS